MRKKGLAIVIVILLFAVSAHSQTQFEIVWSNYFTDWNWYPLTYDCDGQGDVIMDGTVVEIWRDVDLSGTSGTIHTSADHILPVGTNGGAGEIMPTNSFVFNSSDFDLDEGSFYGTGFMFMGATPSAFYYFVIRCPIDGTVLWVSHLFMVSGGFDEVVIGDSLENIFSNPIWSECESDCNVPVCEAPPPVQNFEASEDCYQIALTWDQYQNAEANDVDSLVITREGRFIAAVSPEVVHFIDSSPLVGESYTYKICARRDCPMLLDKASTPAIAVGTSSELYDSPEIISVSTDLCDSVVVVFNNPIEIETYDEILLLRGSEVVATIEAGISEEQNRRIVHYNAPPEEEWYHLRGRGEFCGEGPVSNTRRGMAYSSLEAVEGVQATDGHPQFVTVEWDAVEGADYYRVYRDGEFIDEASLYTVIIDNPPEEGVAYHYQVTAVNPCGESEMSSGDWGYFGTTSVEPLPNASLVSEFALHTNYPNPFNQTTWIEFDIAQTSPVELVVYDLLGKEVAVLLDSQLGQGRYKVGYPAEGLSSGVYLYRLTAGNYAETKKMILMK